MNEEIILVSEDVSALLRYISSEQGTGVTLAKEIEYTEKYLKLMQLRSGSSLTYDLQIPELLNSQKIHSLKNQYPSELR